MKKLSLLLAVLLLILAGCAGSAPEGTRGTAAGSGNSAPTATGLAPSTGDSLPAAGNVKPSPVPSASDTTPPQLTAEEAQAIALEHAGLTADQVTRLRTEPDRDWGTLHYDVEFHHGGYEYDYEIDAVSGAILTAEKDFDD